MIETVKSAMFLKYTKTNNTISDVLRDLYLINKPHVFNYSKRNPILPFEDATSLEFLSSKCDCSLFAFASHSKKRPNNLTLGRMYDNHVLDMVEFGVEKFKKMADFLNANEGTTSRGGSALGSKPCFVFQGQEFEQNEDFKRIGNLLLDFFRGIRVESINLAGLDHVIVCSSVKDKIYFRRYGILLKKSGTRIPRVELSEIGPSLDFTIRRTRFASPDLLKEASWIPKVVKDKKVKNKSRDSLGRTMIKIHMGTQNLNSMDVKRPKALRGKRREREGDQDDTPRKVQKEG